MSGSSGRYIFSVSIFIYLVSFHVYCSSTTSIEYIQLGLHRNRSNEQKKYSVIFIIKVQLILLQPRGFTVMDFNKFQTVFPHDED